MTPGVAWPAGPASNDTTAPVVDRPEALLDLASGWLGSEAASVREPGRIVLVTMAAERAVAYEAALAAATPQDIRLAWEQAVVRQARHDVGSVPWATAFRVSELLRFEEKAARTSQAATGRERGAVPHDELDRSAS